MKISLIGYGKMGKIIEQIAISRHHTISYKITQNNQQDLQLLSPENTDVVIEFTQPESAFDNIATCLNKKIPVICGTTGWLLRKPEIETICLQNHTAFLQASNFSIGVNIFFKVNELLAKLMNEQPQYEVALTEIHHTEKKDAPSGTAIVIADGVLKHFNRKDAWTLLENEQANIDTNKIVNHVAENLLPITALRLPNVPGTHTISYHSTQDTISFTHEAHSREGFALGAVIAAEWLKDKKGNFTMADVISNLVVK
jgi:4-hydroxy-tetrahydrodipicolinate reductase